MKGLDGSLFISDEEQLKRWKQHFDTILNRVFVSDVVSDTRIRVPDLSNTSTMLTTSGIKREVGVRTTTKKNDQRRNKLNR